MVEQKKNRSRRQRKRPAQATSLPTIAFVALVSLSLLLINSVSVSASASREIDAERGGECVDSDPVNCPFWAATGECQKNKGYMHVHCKKSCNRCNVVRVNNRAEINRFMDQKKKEIEEKRERKRKEKEALQALEGGLSLGSGEQDKKDEPKDLPPPTATTSSTTTTTTATVSATGEVESTTGSAASGETVVSTAKSEAADAAVQTSTPTTSTQPQAKEKPKRKRAKLDAETGLECVDLHENCPFWAATGDCKTNRSFMSTNCRLSCDRCHIVRVNNQNDIRNHINRKNKEIQNERRARKQAREIQKVLEGEL